MKTVTGNVTAGSTIFTETQPSNWPLRWKKPKLIAISVSAGQLLIRMGDQQPLRAVGRGSRHH